MKNLIKLLPIVALFIGTSVAFASTTKQDDPTLFYNSEGQWQQIPENFRVECDLDPIPNCTATGSETHPENIEKGNATLVEN